MSRSAVLYHLQLVDQKLDAHRRRLAEIKTQLGETAAVRDARARLAQAEAALAEIDRRQRQAEGERQVLAGKIGEVEARLYGGKVLNPKELTDLQKDIASLNKRRLALEDDELNCMIAADESRAARDLIKAQAAAIEQGWLSAQKDTREELARVEAQIAAISEEHAITESSVPPDDLALYRTLRQRKGGVAVGVLKEGACSACGVAPSATRVSNARSEDTLVRCGFCERILYVDLDRFVSDDDL